MVSDRVLKFVIVALVLLLASLAGREGAWAAVATAIVGLSAGYWRAVLGIPTAIAMVAAVVYAPGVAVAGACLVGLLVLLSIFIKVLFDWGGPPPSNGLSGSDAANLWGPTTGGGNC